MKKDEILEKALEIVRLVAEDKRTELKIRLSANALIKQIKDIDFK